MELASAQIYHNPDHAVLSKYGFKETSLINTYEAVFKNGIKAELLFVRGLISIYEFFVDENFIRVSKLDLANDNELEILLRQTFPSPIYES